MNAPDLSEGRALVDAMTEGSWEHVEPKPYRHNLVGVSGPPPGGSYLAEYLSDADADGTVWLRNNAAALLAEAARARTLEAALEDLKECIALIGGTVMEGDFTRRSGKRARYYIDGLVREKRVPVDTQEGP